MAGLGSFGGSAPIVEALSGFTGSSVGGGLQQQARDQLKESPEGAYTVGRVKVGTFSRDSATDGDQAITGLGGTPYMIHFIGVEAATTETSWGFEAGGSARQCIYRDTDGTFNTLNGGALRFDQGASVLFEISSTAFNADGFTVTWARTGAHTGTVTVHYAAYLRG